MIKEELKEQKTEISVVFVLAEGIYIYLKKNLIS